MPYLLHGRTSAKRSRQAVDEQIVAKQLRPSTSRRCSFSTAISAASSSSLTSGSSIMTVRTLDESLGSTNSTAAGADNVPSEAAPHEVDTGTSTSTKARAKRQTSHVTFASITIREYPIELGDNPSVSSGPPIAIGWSFMTEQTIPFDEYERSRPYHRSLYEMIIPSSTRTDILCDADISLRLIQETVRTVNVTKRQRRRTVQSLRTSWIEEMSERTRRALVGRVVGVSKKRQERELVERGLQCDRMAALAAARK